MNARPRRRLLLGERGFFTGPAIRLALAFTLVGLAANEIGQMIMTKIHVENAAGAAAQAGADAWFGTKNTLQVRDAAELALAQSDPAAKITGISIAPQGAVTVTARETAHTVFVRRVSFLQHFGVQTAEDEETHT